MENVEIWLSAILVIVPDTLAAIDAHPFATVIIAACVMAWIKRKF